MASRHTLPSADFFQKNRTNFIEKMAPSSLATFWSEDELIRNGDVQHPYRQCSDFFYLTGIELPGCRLIFNPEEVWQGRELLYIPKPDPAIEDWNGPMLTIDQAKAISGIDKVFFTNAYETHFMRIQSTLDQVYVLAPSRSLRQGRSEIVDFLQRVQEREPGLNIRKAGPVLAALREIKSDQELKQMGKAIEITRHGFEKIVRSVRPGLYEYELEAMLASEFISRGSHRHGYEPILGSGVNSTYLHYVENAKKIEKGDVILMDAGAEYGYFSADITRVFPASGKFSRRQKAIYEAVLDIQLELIEKLKPGALWKDVQADSLKLTGNALKKLKLIKDAKDEASVRKYYMHGFGHLLGMNVHDVGFTYDPMKAGQVFTVEPGIYVRGEGIGVRIEDDVLITEKGPKVLSSEIVKTIKDVEALAAS